MITQAQTAPKAGKGKNTQGTVTKKQAPAAPLDVNTASAAELVSVPGIGAATAKKIIAGRPYGSVEDLKKTGMSAKQLAQITPMVTVGGRSSKPATQPPMFAPPQKPTRMSPPSTAGTGTPAGSAPISSTPAVSGRQSRAPKNAPTVAYTAPPSAGMVWVNKETKVYHKQGDPWYGRTKQGSYMTEADAMKAGYRASKEK